MTDDEEFYKRTTMGEKEQGDAETRPTPTPNFIGPYKIESMLEKGGMSILYLGTHPETKAPTAIKVLSPKFLKREDVIKRFLHEAEIIALADHPNIVKLYGYGEWEKGLYIAMEFIEGYSLRQYLLRHPISLKQAIEIIIDIAYALCHLHTHGVIHRDLKPENILLNENGSIKVIDFGIAQLIERPKDESGQKSPRIIGTPIYMSPEQKENPEEVTYSSDIYSLGIIAYELILGKLSHGRIHLSLMPKGIQKILSKTLQPEALNRYQDVVDLISDLSSYAQSSMIQTDSLPSDRLKEMADGINSAFQNLCPVASPLWGGIESYHILYYESLFSSQWYDFLVHKNQTRALFIFESKDPSIEGVVYMAVVRGILKSLFPECPSYQEFLRVLNQKLITDQIPKGLGLNMLLFHPDNKSFSFFSSNQDLLWLFKEGKNDPETFGTKPTVLGKEEETLFEIIEGEWTTGDTLILLAPSLHDQPDSIKLTRAFVKDKLHEIAGLSIKETIVSVQNKIKRSAFQNFKSKNCFLAGFKKT